MNKIFMIAFMVVMTLAGMAAHAIGDMYTDGTVDGVFHKIIHGGLGAAAGGALDGKDGAVTGAIGAVMATTLADIGFDEKKEALALVNDNPDVSVEEFESLLLERFKEHATYVKVATAIGALCNGRDVDLASQMATNALDNNCLGVVMKAARPLFFTAKKAYDLAQKIAPMVQLMATLEKSQRKCQERTGEDAEDILLEEADEALAAAERMAVHLLNEKAGGHVKSTPTPAKTSTPTTTGGGGGEDPEGDRRREDLAKKVAEQTGGKLIPAKKDGYTIKIPYKKDDIIVRIMNRGGQRSEPYLKISETNTGKALSNTGRLATGGRGETHIPIDPQITLDLLRKFRFRTRFFLRHTLPKLYIAYLSITQLRIHFSYLQFLR